MGAGSGIRRCHVLGDPIAHSLSPTLHRAGYAAVGLDWEYSAHRVVAGGLSKFVNSCDAYCRGFSVTAPLKREALEAAEVASDRALAARAANTLILDAGVLYADNTDIPGAIAAIREKTEQEFVRVSILGGGATAGSILLALAELGCREFTIHVRSPQRAAETLEVAERWGSLNVVVAGLEDPIDADLLVSTIPATAQTPDLIARAKLIPVLFDVIYDPWPTPLAAAARADRRIVVGGLDLLVHQAALQFTAFTGVPAPLEAMRAAGEAALASTSTQH